MEMPSLPGRQMPGTPWELAFIWIPAFAGMMVKM